LTLNFFGDLLFSDDSSSSDAFWSSAWHALLFFVVLTL
jgi:hypothetical protein